LRKFLRKPVSKLSVHFRQTAPVLTSHLVFILDRQSSLNEK